jgi:hypothetical protein
MIVAADCRNVFPPLSGFPQTDKGTRITGVTLVGTGPASALVNDTNIPVSAFGGIDVQCEAAIDPNSISRPTCFLTIEYPIDFSNQGVTTTYFPVKVAGTVTTAGGVISWRPLAQTFNMLEQLILASPSERGILTRLVLKGNFIWSQSDPASYLDGEVFGSHPSGVNNLSLTLPSGDKRRGGDFETWFWLIAAPSLPSGITPSSAQIYGAQQQVFTVTFSNPVPTAGALTLTSSAPTVATVPATVAVAVGVTSVTFTATSPTPAAGAVTVTGQTNITAAFGGQSVIAILVVAPPPALTGQLQLSAASILVGGTSTGAVALNAPAPAGGAIVTLGSQSPTVATVPSSVTIAANATSGSFTITGVAPGSATITATLITQLTALITVRSPKAKEKEIISDIKVADVKTKDVVKGAETAKSEEIKLAGSSKSAEAGKIADGATSIGVSPLSRAAAQTSTLARSFIRPEERPEVEQAALNAPRVE